MIILREGNLDISGFSALHTEQSVLKSGDEASGSKYQCMVLCGSSLKWLSVDFSLVIHDNAVAVFGSAVLDGNLARVLLLLLLQSFLHILIRDGSVRLRNLYALVLSQNHIWLQRYCRGKDKIFALLYLCNIDLRGGCDVQSALFGSIRICAGKNAVGSVLVKYACAVHFFDYLSGNLALPESGNADVLLLLLIRTLKSILKILRGNGNRQFCHAFFQVFNLDTHFDSSSCFHLSFLLHTMFMVLNITLCHPL